MYFQNLVHDVSTDLPAFK